MHPSLKPSLFRGIQNTEKPSDRISNLINRIIADPYMQNELKISSKAPEATKHKIEGILQHYGIPTRFVDVVDNHWIALWMGLNRAEKLKQRSSYYHYRERTIPLLEIANKEKATEDELFQYVLLLAIPFPETRILAGIQSSHDYIEVDLRQALPSTFLRPHAQHGIVLRRKVHQPQSRGANAYDIAPTVVGIIKIRIDRVHDWMGTGELLTQSNLFPPPAYDYGYDILLERSDLFKDSGFSIAKYI